MSQKMTLGSGWGDNQGSNNIMHYALVATATMIMGEFYVMHVIHGRVKVANHEIELGT